VANPRLKDLAKSISAKHLFFIILFWLVIFNLILSASFSYPLLRLALSRYWTAASLLLLAACLLVWGFAAFSLAQPRPQPGRAIAAMSPILLLYLWPQQETDLPLVLPLAIVAATQAVFYRILFCRQDQAALKARREKIFLAAGITLYFALFSFLAVRKFNALAAFNPRDIALFNQILWNTARGKFFLNSMYGSHFACHNSPFYLFLVPFYRLLPHPLTLIILKLLLLALSAIPFYLITRNILSPGNRLPLVAALMFFPFIAGQNFTPPHETGFAPLFVLFTFYFYQRKRIIPFLCFLGVSVSLKESLAPLAMMFGAFALIDKRSPVWSIWPACLGIAWLVFSLALINHFQNLYQPHHNSAWFFLYLRDALRAPNKNGPLGIAAYLLSNANLAHWDAWKYVSLLFLPLGALLPLLGPASLLGLPEFALNLISTNRAMFSPYWHYSTALSCFLLIGTAQGIKRITSFAVKRKWLGLEAQKLQSLFSVGVLSCTLIYSYAWLELASYKKDAAYIQEVKATLSLVPLQASIAVPVAISPVVSGREHYSIFGPGCACREEYFLIDKLSPQDYPWAKINADYREVCRKGRMVLYRKKTCSSAPGP
jgi:uncharacterized membrane protein